ncbi:MAG: efflux RND transporter periplasmic adaptor subunit [Verrucomicrobiae bacterium]|nr:efflux RND transporter periplasmic adaptor subunit [Verrucomicrobiae bacterium]
MAGEPVEQSGRAEKAILIARERAPGMGDEWLDGTALQAFLDPSVEISANRREFLQSFAAHLGALLGAAAVIVQEGGDQTGAVPIFYLPPSRRVDLQSWIPSSAEVGEVLKSGEAAQADVIVAGRHQARLMFPFHSPGEAPLCITAFFDPGSAVGRESFLGVARLASLAIARRDALFRLGEGEVIFDQSTLLVDLVSRTAGADSFKQSLQILAIELEKFFACLRVAIGTGSSRSCHVQAVSGMSQGDKRSLGQAQLASAMREAIALGETTIWPPQDDLSRELTISANQDDLLHSFGAGRILVVPLEHEEMGVRGAMALLWPREAPLIPGRTHRLVQVSQPHLAALVAFLDRSKPRAFRAGLRRQWNGGPAKRLAIAIGAVLLVGGLLFPITNRVPAECRVEPLLRRTIAAPFESRLEKSHVKPGDRVEKDQILAELDGREIRVALAEAIASRSAALKKRDNAMVQADPSSVQMAQLEADRLELEVQRLQFRNDHLIIRAPLAGVVLAGDLERSEGVPVTAGQKLFEVAPLEGLILEVAVPDGEVRHVEPGMKVTFRLESDGGRRRETRLETLHPAAEVLEGEHVFMAEAPLANDEGFFRPGMKGEARVWSDKKPVAWVFFHGLWEFLRLKLW